MPKLSSTEHQDKLQRALDTYTKVDARIRGECGTVARVPVCLSVCPSVCLPVSVCVFMSVFSPCHRVKFSLFGNTHFIVGMYVCPLLPHTRTRTHTAAQSRVQVLKGKLLSCKELLQCRQEDLRLLWVESVKFKQMLKLFDTM